MKLTTLLIMSLIGSFSVAQTNTDLLSPNTVLSCHADMTVRWGGYNVFVKKMKDNSIKAVLEQYNLFSRDDYSKPFNVIVKNAGDGQTTIASKSEGIEFTVYTDEYSGELAAEAYSDKYEGPVKLFCELDTVEDFKSLVTLEDNDDTDYSNLRKLVNSK